MLTGFNIIFILYNNYNYDSMLTVVNFNYLLSRYIDLLSRLLETLKFIISFCTLSISIYRLIISTIRNQK